MIIGSSQVGGAEKQFLRTAENLRLNHEIAICVLGREGPYTSHFSSFNGQVLTSSGTIIGDLYVLFRSFREIRPDCVSTWLYKADVLGSLISFILNVPCVISARNTQWPRSNSFKRLLLRLVSKYFCTAIVANSQRARDFHASMGYPQDKMQVIPNFLDDPSSVAKKSVRPSLTLGLAARPVPGKGHFLAVDVLRATAEMLPETRLKFIGFGVSEWKDLLHYLSQLNLNVDIEEGLIDLDSWFKSIDIYLALSTMWDSDSNSVLEAIVREIPVLCSPLQVPEELVGLLKIVDPNDPVEVAHEINEIAMTPRKLLDKRLAFLRSHLEASRDPTKIANSWSLLFDKLDENG